MSSIDFRSDTVTKPSEAMRQAMVQAEVGDDVYGDDPSVNRLEEEVAKLIGKEAALYVPSGCMANQIAINLHCQPGDSVLTEADAHCFRFESGAASANSGVQFDFFRKEEWGEEAIFSDRLRGDNMVEATTRLMIVENTHNLDAGRAEPKERVEQMCELAHRHGLKTHCDGARLWNAAVATNTSEADLVRKFDTVAVCFSKGLGAPVGSALLGPKEFIHKARKVRKRFGGGMRQAGIIAEGARFAVEHNRGRLKDDHASIEQIYKVLSEKPDLVEVRYPELATNIIYFKHNQKAGDQLLAELTEHGVLANHLGGNWIRFVSHMHIAASDVEKTIEVLNKLIK